MQKISTIPVYSAFLLSASSTGITGSTAFCLSGLTADLFSFAVFLDKWVKTLQEPWERRRWWMFITSLLGNSMFCYKTIAKVTTENTRENCEVVESLLHSSTHVWPFDVLIPQLVLVTKHSTDIMSDPLGWWLLLLTVNILAFFLTVNRNLKKITTVVWKS